MEKLTESQKQARQDNDAMAARIAARTTKRPEITAEGITLPAGEYYIGDPCYLLRTESHEDWIQILEDTNYFEEPYVKDGLTVVAFGTKHGDGIYTDEEGDEYPVDTGMIAVVPVALARPNAKRCSWTEYPDVEKFHLVPFSGPFLCRREEEGGLLRFGHVAIDTASFWEGPKKPEHPDYDFISWDWKQQIDMDELNTVLQKIPGAIVKEIPPPTEAFQDEFVVVVHAPELKKTDEEWGALYVAEFYEKEEETEGSDLSQPEFDELVEKMRENGKVFKAAYEAGLNDKTQVS